MNAITGKTWIPAGVVLLALGATVSVTTYVLSLVSRVSRQEDRSSIAEAHMNALDVKLDAIAQSVSEINVTLRERSSDYVTGTEFRTWRRQFAHDNPALLIPEWIK